MAPRFDFESLTLELAVADLLDQRLARSLGFANRGGYERLWLGQAIHSRYQEAALERDPTYQREVHLRRELEHRGWRVVIEGRADGLRKEEDGSRVVEEIKSVRRGAQLAPATRELYARQAALYAWMLDHLEESPVRAELILIEIGGDDFERIPVDLNLPGLEANVKRQLNTLIRQVEAEREAAGRRRRAGKALTFPFPELRPGQEEIVDAVRTAVEHREHVLVEAPTGIGKTAAALFPALAYALEHGKRLFVLTAKTLQQDMAMKVLGLLDQAEAFHSLRLRAKSKMCANDQLICHEEYCPYARDYYLKLAGTGVIPALLDEMGALEPDAIFEAAKSQEVCPFEISLELSRQVQVTVCDYNYAFDPYVSLSDFSADSDLSDTILVIDEIHNLVDRGRGYYSPTLSARAARRTAEAVLRGGDRIHLRVAALAERLALLIEATVTEALEAGAPGARSTITALPEDELWQLRPAFDNAFVDFLEYRRETKSFVADDPFVDLYFALLRFLNGLVLSDGSFSHYVAREAGDDLQLRILCRDPSRFLGEVIDRVHSTIGLSATLSPAEFYRDLLGFTPGRTAAVSIPSPFPADRRKVVIDSTVATTYRERPANFDPIAERIAAFADSVPGNTLVLFPSYSFLAEVASRMPQGNKRVLIQKRAGTDREREEILDHLRGALLRDVLLLAVAGGVFAEGVDYPGDMLKAVAIVGPCLPALTLEQQLLREYYDERFERGFEYAFVVPGMTRVVQAAGRLIRAPEDCGVIALLDRRFLHRPYREHLPNDWLPDDGSAKDLTGNPAQTATDFFAALR